MTSLEASAPGKLVLTGDYAVLDGAPAVVAATEPRARVELRSAASFSASTMGFKDASYGFSVSARGLEWTGEDESPLPLVDAVWRTLLPAGRAVEPFSMVLDTSAFSDDGQKFGLGSSAALTVALCGALVAWFELDEHVEEIAARAHRDFQGGRGSGLDIATSAKGGLIVFTIDDSTVESITWPGGLAAAVLWSGVPASTAARLEKLALSKSHPSREGLEDAAFVAAYAWQSGNVDEVLVATSRFGLSLRSFSDAYDLDIYGAGHAELASLAEHESLVYKPCGAGGGDSGIVLGTNAADIARFVEAAHERGFRELPVLDTHQGNQGLRIEWTPG